jgi:Flp pilus assembly protein TadD
MLSGLEPGAVVLARNDETVFPLWYARYVEGRREDVAIIDVRSRAPHLERWFPDVRFPTEEELAASFGSPEMADCSPDGRSVLPAQRYAPLLVALNIEDRPIFADYELARSRFLDRSLPAGYLARIASHPIEAGALGDPEELIDAGPWSRWLGPDAAPAGPRTVKIAAARLEEAGKLYLVRGRAADAVMVMEHAAAGAPRLTKAWNDLGVAYVATGRVDEGIEALRRAADLDPSEASTRANLFDAYRRAGLEEEAVRQIRAAIRLEPEETRYRTLLALYLERKGAVREAADVLEEARRALPDDHAAALALGDLLVRSGDYAEALSVYRRAEELDPGSPVVQSSLGRCYWALHDVERAVRAMSRSVELQPQNPRLRYDLAVMLRAIGRRDEALGHLSEAVRVLPGMWRAHLLSAAILLELGRYDDAERELARAAEAGADPGALRQVRLDAAVARGDSAAAARLRRKPGDAVIEP